MELLLIGSERLRIGLISNIKTTRDGQKLKTKTKGNVQDDVMIGLVNGVCEEMKMKIVSLPLSTLFIGL